MLRSNPALCWKYLAQLGNACLGARPNAAHAAIARLQLAKPGCWVLTQNIDGYHLAAGSPAQRLIEIHGQLAPLFCQSCGTTFEDLHAHLLQPLPPRCALCAGILRPPVVLFEELLPEDALNTLYEQLAQGFDAVLVIGTTASFPYIVEPVWRTQASGGFTVEVNPVPGELSREVDVYLQGRALDVVGELISHILFD
ncbi:NAD-dependent protein deacetylase [compost metagenome]